MWIVIRLIKFIYSKLCTALNKVKTEISQKTQQQLKDFTKSNPDLKQPRVQKEQQTLQR